MLADRLALAGQRALHHAQRGGLDEPAVGRDSVARLEQHDVAGDELFGADSVSIAVAHDGRSRCRELLERLEGLLGAVLLHEAEHAVEQQDREDRDRFEHLALDRRDDHGEQEDVDHEVLEL